MKLDRIALLLPAKPNGPPPKDFDGLAAVELRPYSFDEAKAPRYDVGYFYLAGSGEHAEQFLRAEGQTRRPDGVVRWAPLPDIPDLLARVADLRRLADEAAAEQGLAQRRMMEAQAARDRAQGREKAEADRAEIAEAKAAVCGGEWCAENRAAGRGPCGACAWCCTQERNRAEAAESTLLPVLRSIAGCGLDAHDAIAQAKDALKG